MLLSLSLRIFTMVVALGPPGDDLEDPGPKAPEGINEIASQWISEAKFFLMLGGVLGLFCCFGMMMIGRKNRSNLAGEGASGLLWVMAGLSGTSLAVPLVNQIL